MYIYIPIFIGSRNTVHFYVSLNMGTTVSPLYFIVNKQD